MTIHITDRESLTKCLLLFTVFDGDPNEWMSYLADGGSRQQWEDDLPFVHWLIQEDERDETFLRDLRLLFLRTPEEEH